MTVIVVADECKILAIGVERRQKYYSVARANFTASDLHKNTTIFSLNVYPLPP